MQNAPSHILIITLFLFVLSSFTSCLKFWEPTTIKIPFYRQNQKISWYSKMCVGQPTQCFPDFKLSTWFSYVMVKESWAESPGYSPSSSQTSMKLIRQSYQDYFVFDYDLNDDTDKKIPWNFKWDSSYIMGLGPNFKRNNENSWIGSLLKNGKISKSIFYLQNKDFSNGDLILGNYPKEKRGNYKNYKNCKMIPNDKDGYACMLNGIYFNDQQDNPMLFYPVNNKVYFDTETNYISVPGDFFDYMIDRIFKDGLATKNCLLAHTRDYDKIICNADYYNNKLNGQVSFVLGKWNIKWKIERMLEGKDENWMFLIVRNNIENKWSFGNLFLMKYIIVFDNEENEIGIIEQSMRNDRSY